MKHNKNLLIIFSLIFLLFIALPTNFAINDDNMITTDSNVDSVYLSVNQVRDVSVNDSDCFSSNQINLSNADELSFKNATNSSNNFISTDYCSSVDGSGSVDVLSGVDGSGSVDVLSGVDGSGSVDVLSGEDTSYNLLSEDADNGSTQNSSDNEISKHFYFDASLEDDTGDGSFERPYKYFNSSRLVENSTLHLANGEYIIEYPSSFKNMTIIGTDPLKTILKYAKISFSVFAKANLINLTMDEVSLNSYNANLTNVIFKNSFSHAIYSNVNASLYNCTFMNNEDGRYSVVYINGGNLYSENSTFINISNFDNGGAITLINSTYSFINNTNFINDKSINGAGGALLIRSSSVNLSNVEFTNCNSNFGGAVAILESSVSLSSIKFNNNSAKFEGGAIYQMYGNFSLTDSVFENNSACNGGALFIDNASSFTVLNNDFYNNTASMTAGAIYSLLNNHTNSLNDSESGNLFIDNEALYFYDIFDSDKLNLFIGNGNYTMHKLNLTDIGELPDYYNLVDEGFVTSVKSQEIGGNCWAFASIAAIESCILKADGTYYDFSDNNMKNIMARYSDYGWDRNPNSGGLDGMPLAYLTSWLGPVYETEDPYYDHGLISPVLDSHVHVQNIIFLKRNNLTDNDEIKKALMQYGAVVTNMRYEGEFINRSSYYFNLTSGSNHAVTIVGWDDNYSASKFKITPPGDGAWIVKNSWGSGWADHGYFYVSYYDKSFARVGKDVAAYTFFFNDTIRLEKNYQYDIGGQNSYYHLNPSTVWYKNKFFSTENELLAAVSTYFEKETQWDLSITVNGENKLNQSGQSIPGYFTINLNNFIPLKKGDEFEVIFKLTGEYPGLPVFKDYFLNKRVFTNNISFSSLDGINWKDISPEIHTGFYINGVHKPYYTVASIKAFTITSKLDTFTSLEIISIKNNRAKLVATVKDFYNNTILNGNITFNLNGQEIIAEIRDGIAEIEYDFDKLSNNISASFYNSYYNSTNFTTLNFSEEEMGIDLSIEVKLDSASISINALKDINAKLLLLVNEDEYLLDLTNGTASLLLKDLNVNNYTVFVKVLNEIYNASNSSEFSIELIPTKIVAPNMVTDDFSLENYDISLLDELNNGLFEKSIIVSISEINNIDDSDASVDSNATIGSNDSIILNSTNTNFNLITDLEGKVHSLINLKAGNYLINIKFVGDEKYASSEANYSLKIKDKINLEIEILQKVNDLKLTLVANKTINETAVLYINDSSYIVRLHDGIGELSIKNISNGNYSFHSYLLNRDDFIVNNTQKVFEINLKDLNIIVTDFETFEYSNECFIIALMDSEGDVICNKSVIIVLDGVEHVLVSDDNGQIALPIGLSKGRYFVSVSFDGDNEFYSASSNATVMVKENIDLNIQFNQNINNLNVTVKANKSINASVNLFINNNSYIVDLEDGIGNISLYDLQNDNYTAYAVFIDNDDFIASNGTNTIEINLKDLNILANDFETFEYSNESFIIALMDSEGDVICNKSVIIVLDGVEHVLVSDDNGQIALPISLSKGRYFVSVSFDGDNEFYSASSNLTVMVKEEVSLDIGFIQNVNNLNVTVKANKSIDARVKIFINNNYYFLTLKDGEGDMYVKNLRNNNYTAYAVFVDNDDFISSKGQSTIELNLKDFNILANDFKTFENSNEAFLIELTDDENNPLANKTLLIELDNNEFIRTTDSQGQTTVPINLSYGEYPLSISFKGDNDFSSKDKTFKINVLETIRLDIEIKQDINNVKIMVNANRAIDGDLILYFNNQSYHLELKEGKAEKEFYSLKNNNYTVSLDFDYKEDSYVISHPKTFQINLYTLSISMDNLQTYEYSGDEFQIKLYSESNISLANKTLKISIGNKDYTVITNESGQASLPISLPKGDYSPIISFNGDNDFYSLISAGFIKVMDSIKLESFIEKSFNNINITVKASRPINDTVIISINNQIKYLSLVDGEGKIEIENLKNNNYTISSDLINSWDYVVFADVKTIEINIKKVSIIADYLETYENSNVLYNITLLEDSQIPLEGKKLFITLDDKTYIKTTDNNGQVSLAIDLVEGSHIISILFESDDPYMKNNASNLIVVRKAIDANIDVETDYGAAKINILFEKDNPNMEDINEDINLTINNGTYTVKIINNAGLLQLDDLSNGTYLINLSLDKYQISQTKEFTIINDFLIVADNLTCYNNSDNIYTVQLLNGNRALENKTISFTLNDESITKTTDNNGKASININMDVGLYVVYITNVENNVSILKFINVLNPEIGGNSSSNSSSNSSVNSTNASVNGTNSSVNGTNSSVNSTNASVNGSNGSSSEPVLEQVVIIASDLVTEEHSNVSYNITLKDKKSNVIPYVVVVIKLNDQYYYLPTDANGKIGLSIDLAKGTYDILINFKGTANYAATSLTKTIFVKAASIVNGSTNSSTNTSINSSTRTNSSTNSSVNSSNPTNGTVPANSSNSTLVNGSGSVGGNSTLVNGSGSVGGNSTLVNGSGSVGGNSTLVNGSVGGNSSNPINKTNVTNGTIPGVNGTNPNSTSPNVNSTNPNSTSPGVNGTSPINGSNPINSTVPGVNVTSPNGTDSINNNSNKTHRMYTKIICSDMVTTAVTNAADRLGEYFKFKLVDQNGKPLVNKFVQIGFNGKKYDRYTDKNGEAQLQVNLKKAFIYTFAVAFLSDDDYYASFEVAKITVKEQKASLNLDSKTYKLKAKTKKITATFKDARGVLLKGKSISFIVNGNIYTAKTNSKGIATVNVSLNKKGTYKVLAKFAGDDTFSTISKSNKVVIV